MTRSALILTLGLAACSSVQGRYVGTSKPTTRETAKGVSYLLTRPTFEVQRKTLHNGKKARQMNEIVVTATPDPQQRFEVGMQRGLFSADSFEVKISPSGTLSALSATSTDVTGKAIVGLAKLAAEVAKLVALRVTDNLKACFRTARTRELITDTELTSVLAAIDELGLVTPRPPGSPAPSPAVRTEYLKVAKKAREGFIGNDTKGLVGAIGFVDSKLESAGSNLRPLATGELELRALERDADADYGCILLIEGSEARVRSSGAVTSVAATLAKLRKAVDDALAGYVADPATVQNRTDYLAALKKYRDAVALVLAADEALNHRGLYTRRMVLVDFLRRPIPSEIAEGDSTIYAQLSAELGQVSQAIAAALGTSSASAPKTDDLPLATEVTSRIREKVFVDRFLMRLDSARVAERVRLAKARVRFAGYKASTIVFPLLSAKEQTK